MKYIELLQFSAEIKGADVVREKLATIIPRASPLTLNKSLMAIAHATESEESKMLVKACIGTFEYLREKNCYFENFITYVFAEDTQKLSSASIDRLLSILAKEINNFHNLDHKILLNLSQSLKFCTITPGLIDIFGVISKKICSPSTVTQTELQEPENSLKKNTQHIATDFSENSSEIKYSLDYIFKSIELNINRLAAQT
ncbi:hypothetical protein [Paraburkholderia bonniea]|uniref:hypothetical protein n=1 Tax=Paraburkholderia bonniea TaxID=2152891 RepID=UPI00129200A5|nr:hypothetical protein [Paraburkholderia bonniea]